MKQTNEEKLKRKNVELKKELELSKKKVKSLESKLSTSEKKRKALQSSTEKKKDQYIPLSRIKRHNYPEFIVKLCVLLYVRTRCGFRGVVTIISILNELLHLDLKEPCFNSIENWVKKSGFSIYKEPAEKLKKEEYAVIVDESMMIGSQKILMTLGVEAKHKGKALSHSDVEILGITVRPSWNGEAITSELKDISKKVGHNPLYAISDNASTMNKGIRESNLLHIRDISHTLGLIMKRIYDKDEEFNSYMKELSQVKFKQVMNPVAYLLPPKQRTIARFINLSQVVEWSNKILMNYYNLTEQERKIFSFILRYASFIDELQNVLSCINSIEHEVKQKGLSINSLTNCMGYIKQSLFTGNERMIKIGEQIVQYLREETKKIPENNTCWNASSDVLESFFGVFKARKSPNLLHGVTPFVLFLPVYARLSKKSNFDFKKSLESVFMSDIETWKKEKLFENQVYKRTKKLKIA